MRLNGQHFPVSSATRNFCSYCLSKDGNRSHQSHWKCRTCDVFLCLNCEDSDELNCFEKWHTHSNLGFDEGKANDEEDHSA
jgi:hypothetical protein